MQGAGIKQEEVWERTVCRYLNAHGYLYLQSKKKGLMTEKDMQNIVKFAKKMGREYSADVWTRQIGFYLDDVAFAYKRNPVDQAKVREARIWRKKSAGWEIGCASKGRKEGTREK